MKKITLCLSLLLMAGLIFCEMSWGGKVKQASWTDVQVDQLGEALAKWCNLEHVNVSFDGVAVLGFQPSPGGWESVHWDSSHRVKEEYKSAHQMETAKRRQVLAALLKKHGCQPEPLLKNARELTAMKGKGLDYAAVSQKKPADFEKMFSCLGAIKFEKLKFSSD